MASLRDTLDKLGVQAKPGAVHAPSPGIPQSARHTQPAETNTTTPAITTPTDLNALLHAPLVAGNQVVNANDPMPVANSAHANTVTEYEHRAETAESPAIASLMTDMATVCRHLGSPERREQLSNAIRETLLRIQDTPELAHVLLPADIGVMTRALGESYSLTIAKKKENRRKTASSGVKVDATTAAMLGDLSL